MLCETCEQLFGNWESEFKSRCFEPVTKGVDAPTSYGPWLCLFAASVCWRVLTYLDDRGIAKRPTGPRSEVRDVLTRWSQMLRTGSIASGCKDFHFIPSGIVGEITVDNPPPNLNRYLSRYPQLDLVTGSDQQFVFAKLGPAILLGFVQHPATRTWRGTRIDPLGGSFQRRLEVPFALAQYLFEQAKTVHKRQQSISDRQNATIVRAYRENMEWAAQSGTVEALTADVRMFGTEAVFELNDASDSSQADG